METFTAGLLISAFVAGPGAIAERGGPGPGPVAYWDRTPAPAAKDAFLVVIDPGHDPAEPGAMSTTGVREVLYNDRLATRVGVLLRDQPGIEAVLSRRSYELLPLRKRAERIAGLAPDLVVSIHHDAVKVEFIDYQLRAQPSGEVVGIPVCERFSGFSLFAQAAGPNRRRSQQLARLVADGYVAIGLRRTTYHAMKIPGESRRWIDAGRGIHAGDYLYLLRTIDAPVLLIESGFLVNPEDERRLADPEHVEALARVIADAIAKLAADA